MSAHRSGSRFRAGRRSTGGRTSREFARAGFILITALWLLVALSAVGLHAALQLRTERHAAANLLDETRARAAAAAGAEYARSRLTAATLDRADELRAQAQSQSRSQGGGRNNNGNTRAQSVQQLFRGADPSADPWQYPQELVVSEMTFGDSQFTLRVRDSGAAFNLNTADEEMLRNFFAQGFRIDYAQADRLAQAIADWRDEDELPRIGGGERTEYLRAGMPELPANHEFNSIDELRFVMGMTPEIFAAAAPYITLQSSGRINVNAAPEEVLLALPGMTPAAATEIIRSRSAGISYTDANDLLRNLPAGARQPLEVAQRQFTARSSFRTTEIEIISEGRVTGSSLKSRLRTTVTRVASTTVVTAREYD